MAYLERVPKTTFILVYSTLDVGTLCPSSAKSGGPLTNDQATWQPDWSRFRVDSSRGSLGKEGSSLPERVGQNTHVQASHLSPQK